MFYYYRMLTVICCPLILFAVPSVSAQSGETINVQTQRVIDADNGSQNIDQQYQYFFEKMNRLSGKQDGSVLSKYISPKNYAASQKAWLELQKQYTQFQQSKKSPKRVIKIQKNINELQTKIAEVERIKVLNRTYFNYSLSQIELLDQLVIPEYQKAYEKAQKQLYRLLSKVEKKSSVKGLDKARLKVQQRLNKLESAILVARMAEPRKLELLALNSKLIPVHYAVGVTAIKDLETQLNRDPKAVAAIARLLKQTKFSIAKASAIQTEVLKIKNTKNKDLEDLATSYHLSLNSLADAAKLKRGENENYDQRVQDIKIQLLQEATQ